MKILGKRFVVGVLLLMTILAGVGFAILRPYANLGGGYAAKVLAGGLFVADRDLETLVREEVAFLPPGFSFDVDRESKTVTVRMLGLFAQTAVYREGLGTTVVNCPIEELRAQAIPDLFEPLENLQDQAWPQGDAPSGTPRPDDVDEEKLAAAMAFAFKGDPPSERRGTRAVIVVYKGEIVAEQYADGFSRDTRLIGWSMTKSITGALIGILVHQGKLDIMQPAPVPAWHGEGDPRNAITVDMLLRMSSGLEFDENYYSPFADASPMLFHYVSTAAYAAAKPLQYEPDTKWYYSSGTSNIVQQIVRDTIGNDEAYHHFPYRELFGKIGMRSAFLEADCAGTFVGSSYFYATTRDYARFGLLFLNDGVWNGERILAEGWVEYSRTPTKTCPEKRYGAHWWLPTPSDHSQADRAGVALPEDTFCAAGHEGQFIYVVPSRDLVIVRLGLSKGEHAEFNACYIEFLKAFPPLISS